MDAIKRESLIQEIKKQPSSSEDPLPVVTLEQFFEGNDDIGSIGCNLMEHPGTAFFYKTLLKIRSMDAVQEVLVEIYEVEESAPEMWPFSERIYVLTGLPIDEVEELLAPLEPSEISEGWFADRPQQAPILAEGMRVVAAWWD